MYGIALYQEDGSEFNFVCNNEDFLKEFSTLLNKFYNDFDGKINILKSF